MKRVRQRQPAFTGHALRKHGLENLLLTGKIEEESEGASETEVSG